MDRRMTAVSTEIPVALEPWDALIRPIWREFWKQLFAKPSSFEATDRVPLEKFLQRVERFINREPAWLDSRKGSEETFAFSAEEKTVLSKVIDPWGSGLVTIEQISYLEEYFDEPLPDDSLWTLVKELIKIGPITVPKAILNSFGAIDAANKEFLAQILGVLAQKSRPLVSIVYGGRGMGKTAFACQILREKQQASQKGETCMNFYCDSRACFSPNALLSQMARAVRYPLPGDQDPHLFFNWVRRISSQNVFIIIDNIENSESAYAALGSTLNRIFEITRSMKFLVLSTAVGLRDALVACDISINKLHEAEIVGVSSEKAHQLAREFAASASLDDSDLPSNPGHLAYILQSLKRGLVPIDLPKPLTFDSVIQYLLDKPMKKSLNLPWDPENKSARGILNLICIFKDFFDIKAAVAVISGVIKTLISESEFQEILNELMDRGFVEQTNEKTFGCKYAVPRFIRVATKAKSPADQSVKESLNEQFSKYFCKGLASAGYSLQWGNNSSAFHYFDDNHSDFTALLVGRLSPSCFYDYFSVARYASQILKARLSATDQVHFYSKLLELNHRITGKIDNAITESFLYSRMASCYMALDNVIEAKSQASQAVSKIKSSIGGKPIDDPFVKEVLSVALEKEAEVDASPTLLEDVLELKRDFHKRHPSICDVYYTLGSMLETAQKNEEAMIIYKKGLRSMQRLIPNHPLVADTLGRMAILSKMLRRLPEAIESLKEALRIREEYYGFIHPKVGMNRYWMAACLLDDCSNQDLPKLKEAEQYALEGLRILAQTHEPNHYETSNAFKLWDQITRLISELNTSCQLCSAQFTFTFRRHRCRCCGKTICSNCSPKEVFRVVPEMGCHNAVRTCVQCTPTTTK